MSPGGNDDGSPVPISTFKKMASAFRQGTTMRESCGMASPCVERRCQGADPRPVTEGTRQGSGRKDSPPSFRPDAGPGIHKEARAGEPGNTSVKDGHRTLKKNGTGGHPARGKRLFCAVFLRRVGTKVRPGGTRRQNAPGRRTEKGAKNGHLARLRRHVRSCATGLSAIRSSRRRQATKA